MNKIENLKNTIELLEGYYKEGMFEDLEDLLQYINNVLAFENNEQDDDKIKEYTNNYKNSLKVIKYYILKVM